MLKFIESVLSEYIVVWALVLNTLILFFVCGLYIFIKNEKKRWNKFNDYLWDVTKTVNSVRYGDLSKKIRQIDIPDSAHLTESLNRLIDTLKDREAMIDEYQNELIRQNKLLEAVINSLSDGLIITDSEGKIVRATDIIPVWMKCEGKDIIGHNINEYVDVLNKRPLSTWKNSDAVLQADKTSSFVVSTIPLNLEDKKPRYIVILKNVTNQKELESLKEDFVATLTHDLKVPIIAETNMLELFLSGNFGKISEKQKLALHNMQTSNKELLDLVQTVLETYKVGQFTLYKENIMLESFLNEIMTEMKPIAAKTENSITLIKSRDIRVFADKLQLKRVIKNLIQNAISYSAHKTPIEISIGEIPKFVFIKVKDHGAGIAKNDIDKIFNKYYSAAKKFRKIGTGLGLYLAFQIVKAHDGELSVDSVEGDYTEFTIKIPA